MRFVPFVIALAALVVTGQFGSSPTSDTIGVTTLHAQVSEDNPNEATADSIAAGRRVYTRFCASCHGRSGEGDGAGAFGDVPPANLVDDEWVYGGETDGEIFKTIAEGVPPDYFMEEWAGRVSNDDIWNIVNFLRDLGSQ